MAGNPDQTIFQHPTQLMANAFYRCANSTGIIYQDWTKKAINTMPQTIASIPPTQHKLANCAKAKTVQKTSTALQLGTANNSTAQLNAPAETASTPTADTQIFSGRPPFYFDLKMANISVHLPSAPPQMVASLFSPGFLTPSIKHSNPTVHFKPEHWALILGCINTSPLPLSTIQQQVWADLAPTLNVQKSEAVLQLQAAEKNLTQAAQELDRLRAEINGIKTQNRHFKKDPKLANLVCQLEATQKAQRDLKNQAKAEKKCISARLNAWPNLAAFTSFFRTLEQHRDIRSTVLILKLVNEKYLAEEKEKFLDAAAAFLDTHNIEWRPLPPVLAELISFICNENHTTFSQAYAFSRMQFPGYDATDVGDCVETTFRNFLKMIAEARPDTLSFEQWFDQLELQHLIPLKDQLTGIDELEKHLAFITNLDAIVDLSAQKRPTLGCIRADATYHNLTQIMRISPKDIVAKTGAFKDILTNHTKSLFQCTALDGSTFTLEDSSSHAELVTILNTRHGAPGFLTHIEDDTLIEQITQLLILNLGREQLKEHLNAYLHRPQDVSDVADTLARWQLAVAEIQPIEQLHPAQLLIKGFDARTYQATDKDCWRVYVSDAPKALARIKDSSNPTQALMAIMGPVRCANNLDQILFDTTLFRAFNNAMNTSGSFRAIASSRLYRIDRFDLHPNAVNTLRNIIAKVPFYTCRHTALLLGSLSHRFAALVLSRPLNSLFSQFKNTRDRGQAPPNISHNRHQHIVPAEQSSEFIQLMVIGLAGYMLGRYLQAQGATSQDIATTIPNVIPSTPYT